jgi:uncharacterized protein (DUF1501 family)
MKHDFSRRDFLKGAAVFSALGVAPQFITRTAQGAIPAINGFKDDRILVVVQLSGGNDGLNTVVPYGDDAYYNARPQLALKQGDLLTLDDHLGFHKSLKELRGLYDDGKVALIQGVGYPNPNRSHFRSMEIWHTATDSDEFSSRGWIGNYFENECSGEARPQVGVAIGKEQPQAFSGTSGYGVAFEQPATFGWREGDGTDTRAAFETLNATKTTTNDSLDFLRQVSSNAVTSSDEVKEAAKMAGDMKGGRSRNNLDALKTVAGLIRGGLQTRIYYVSMGGFDTHSGQSGKHETLLSQYSQAIAEFQKALQRDGNADRVTTMVFSEFGRRVGQNASGGTDHGTAAPMWIIGNNVNPGLYGKTPSLTDLDQGDLKHNVDFRSVYSTLLEDWFATDVRSVLGQRFDTLPLIS